MGKGVEVNLYLMELNRDYKTEKHFRLVCKCLNDVLAFMNDCPLLFLTNNVIMNPNSERE